MDFSLTDEQELLRDSLIEWLEVHAPEESIKQWYYEDHGLPDEFVKAWVDDGFGLLGIPEEYGGTPVDITTLCLVAYEFHRHFCCMAPSILGNMLALYDMSHWGCEDKMAMCAKYYQETGRSPFCMALSEPGAGSDNMAMTTTVKEVEPGRYIMNGTKTWISQAETADFILVVAKDEDPNGKECSMWLVDKKKKGVSLAPLTKIGQYLAPFCDAYFDDVELTDDDRVGPRGQGFLLLMKNFEVERVIGTAGGIGMAQGCMDDAAAYTTQRVQFGQPIANFELIQEKLTDDETRLINMRNLMWYCCWLLEKGENVRIEGSLLKRYAANAVTQVCADAVEIFAGLGYTHETRVGRAWIDSMGNHMGMGTLEIMVHIAGRQLAKKYAN